MAPLLTKRLERRSHLHPALRIGRDTYYLDPAEIVTIPVQRLSAPIANLDADRDRIVATFDLVFTGI